MAGKKESGDGTLIKRRRRSVFTELDLDQDGDQHQDSTEETKLQALQNRPHRHVRFHSKSDIFEASDDEKAMLTPIDSALTSPRTPRQPDYKAPLKLAPLPSPPRPFPQLTKYLPYAVIVALLVALLRHLTVARSSTYVAFGVEGSVIPARAEVEEPATRALHRRQDTATNWCVKWSHQTAVVNGTLYIYGGHASKSYNQPDNTWTNDFSTLDLTKSWQISSPTLKGLSQPSGPPAVANGYLWNSYASLFLYGGEFSDSPLVAPDPLSLWEYSIASSTWIEHKSPATSAGVNSDGGGLAVQRAAEGAGVNVPQLGRGWYFGGHLDPYTTPGWPQSVFRQYLSALLEFTFPGSTNDAISNLQKGKAAGTDGAWRNITRGGDQGTNGFTDRADGVVVYVPGFSAQGILVALAGGTNASFTAMNIIDVYDIATSAWYRQTTNGEAPSIRVNPCAVAASAPDGSSTNIYMFGGQNLLPYKGQVQYDDMWILTIPSFTWIKVDTKDQSVPYPRAGHTCDIWDGQMIIVGGYIGTNLTCESPGIYVFDASALKWTNQFSSLDGGNALNQQTAQDGNASALGGSYGYQVPAAVHDVIGGGPLGGATVTAPVMTVTAGPLATGKPIIYTVTGASGATATETVSANSSGFGNGGGLTSGVSSSPSGPNVAAIVAGTIAGVLFIVAGYLGFCAWLYRRQLQLYKNHVAMSQGQAGSGGRAGEKTSFLAGPRISGTAAAPMTTPAIPPRTRRSMPSWTGVTLLRRFSLIPSATPLETTTTASSSTDDLMLGHEPSFIGVVLNPRRSLRVVNRD